MSGEAIGSLKWLPDEFFWDLLFLFLLCSSKYFCSWRLMDFSRLLSLRFVFRLKALSLFISSVAFVRAKAVASEAFMVSSILIFDLRLRAAVFCLVASE